MTITETLPVQSSANVSVDTDIVFTFDKNIDASFVDSASVTVRYINSKILSVKGAKQTAPFAKDTFFAAETKDIVDGAISVSANKLTFKPRIPLNTNSEYEVYVSKTIKSVDGDALGKIYKLTFKTREQDVVEPLTPPQEYTRIIGTTVVKDVPVSNDMRVVAVTPAADSFLNSSRIIDVEFSKELKESIGDYIRIKSGEILSDYPMTPVTDFTFSVTGAFLRIVLNDNLNVDNKVFFVQVLKGAEADDDTKLAETYSWSYVANLYPYYGSTKLIRLYAGPVVSGVSDVNMAMHIFAASEDAQRYVSKVKLTEEQKDIFLKKYVVYKSMFDILSNNLDSGINDYLKKDLGFFSITANNKSKVDLYNGLIRESRDMVKRLKDMILHLGSNHVISRPNNGIGRQFTASPMINASVDVGAKNILTWDEDFYIIENPVRS